MLSSTQRIVLFIGLKCKQGPNIRKSFEYVVFNSIRSCSKAVLMLICEDIANHTLKCKIFDIKYVAVRSDKCETLPHGTMISLEIVYKGTINW